ncbi:MAG: hypothetical protein RIR12_443 [Bacteroidota bacterium]|jgi:hypothetical protein
MNIDFVLAMSCAPPALLGLYKYKRVNKLFHPFILTIVLSLITELSTSYFISKEALWPYYYLAANIYLVINVLLFHQFFLFSKISSEKYKWLYSAIFLILFLASAIFLNHPLKIFPAWLNVAYSLYLLGAGVKLLSVQVMDTKLPILRNPNFYIALGCILFYLYTLFTTIVSITLHNTLPLDWHIFKIDKVINVLHYLLFLIAILWMSKKN